MKEISNMGFTPELCFEHLRYHFAQEVKKREKSFVAEPSQMESMKKVASWLTTGKEHCWLVLNGITGNGKTTCVKGMRSFINCCKIPDPSNGEGSVFSSKAGIWLVTARELYQMFVSNKPKFERCANTYILAIDELGTEETDFCEYGNRCSCCRIATTRCSRPSSPPTCRWQTYARNMVTGLRKGSTS